MYEKSVSDEQSENSDCDAELSRVLHADVERLKGKRMLSV